MFWVKTRNNQMVPMSASLRLGLDFSFWKIWVPPTYGLKHATACRGSANFSWGLLVLAGSLLGSLKHTFGVRGIFLGRPQVLPRIIDRSCG